MLNNSRSFQNSPPRDIDDALILTTTIQVMVVDHKKDSLGYLAELLRSYAFEVTCVDHAGAALKILSESKDKFDFLLIDSDLRDVDIVTFLRLTKAMDVLSIVVSEVEDDGFLLQALKNGAAFVFKWPMTGDDIKKARQHVLKDRIHKSQHKFRLIPEASASYNTTDDARINNNNGSYYQMELENDSEFAKKKVCLEWTEELHSKFLEAICVLGEGRCFPKDILETMGVPGLTRMQIASHLQKCRRDGWKFIGKRASSLPTNMTVSGNCSSESIDSRRFGRMPCVTPNSANQEERIPHYDSSSFVNIERQTDVDYMNNQPFTDHSHVNSFGSLQNNGEVFGTGQGPIYPPYQEPNNDFYEVLVDFNPRNSSIPYADLNISELHNSILSGPTYNHGMLNQDNSMFNANTI